jgi:acyl dehydratase
VATVPAPGTALPPLDKPRFTSTHVVRWMAAQQNWDRIHFDQAFCRDVARLEAPVINGALKQHWIAQFLQRALPGAWPWRIDYRFAAPDFVGQKLQVRGSVTSRQRVGRHTFVGVDVEIFNQDRGEATTGGRAVVLLADDGPVLDALEVEAPPGLSLPQACSEPDAAMAAHVNARLGTVLDERESRYPLDLSRLRLFADAVMDVASAHFDPQAPSAWGAVVAPPLFPLHGLEALPGTFPLSEDPRAQGREGVNEVGRDLAPQFGFEGSGMNAGNRVQVHSLARAGERIRVRSTLVGAKRRTGGRGGEMVFFESLNHYTEAGGRPLLTERQASVVKLSPGKA